MRALPLLLRAVLADMSNITTLKACSHLHLLLSTVLDYMPNNATEITFPFLTCLVIIVVVLTPLTIICFLVLRFFCLLFHVEEEEVEE